MRTLFTSFYERSLFYNDPLFIIDILEDILRGVTKIITNNETIYEKKNTLKIYSSATLIKFNPYKIGYDAYNEIRTFFQSLNLLLETLTTTTGTEVLDTTITVSTFPGLKVEYQEYLVTGDRKHLLNILNTSEYNFIVQVLDAMKNNI
jgi:hypothetical protein